MNIEKILANIKWIVILICIILIFILGWRGLNIFENKQNAVPTAVTVTDIKDNEPIEKKYEITSEFLEKNLQNIGRLAAVECSYNGMITATEGNYPVLTQKGYTMYYIGTVTAGIDVEQIKIDINENDVTVTVPKAEIQSINVDPNSITFADIKKAVFNWSDITDGIDGVKIAEQEINKQATEDDILSQADEQTKVIIQGLLEDIVKKAEGERELIIKQQ
ncbi:MAG: DUF4230 domain-containing protein [Ruminococcus sp.]|nr:DUF4230 domain-containing protein [Ruminococcus sp.]MCM1382330.1 DUF4230 domain-containing protein [Muribaculaceae bacterium]MCM1480669.1 DUF4230 domain-containing protein [Muribaculaceae bacterium]